MYESAAMAVVAGTVVGPHLELLVRQQCVRGREGHGMDLQARRGHHRRSAAERMPRYHQIPVESSNMGCTGQMRQSLCHCLSVTVCHCLSLSLSLCLSLRVSPSPSLSLSPCLSLCVSLSVSLSLCLSLCRSLSLSVRVSLSLCLYLSPSLSLNPVSSGPAAPGATARRGGVLRCNKTRHQTNVTCLGTGPSLLADSPRGRRPASMPGPAG